MKSIRSKSALGVLLLAVTLVGIAFGSSVVGQQQGASTEDSSAEAHWPAMTEAAAKHYATLPDVIRNQRGEHLPSEFTEDPGVLAAQVIITMRYGQYRVGSAYPWLREQSKDLWSTPVGISACFALLYFGDTSGIKHLQANIHSISRSPQHWFCLQTAGNNARLFDEIRHSGDQDVMRDLLRRKKLLLPARPELVDAVMALDDAKLATIIEKLDQETLIKDD